MQKLECSCCGGKLAMNADGMAVCQSCGMEYAPEAVQKMLVELRGSVQVEGMDTADVLSKRAETFLSLNEVGKAWEIFSQLANQYPDDYRGWWGETRAMDWEGYFRSNAGQPPAMPVCCQRALLFAPEDKKREIQAFYGEKERQIGQRVQQNYAAVQARRGQAEAAAQAQIEAYRKEFAQCDKEVAALNAKIARLEAKTNARAPKYRRKLAPSIWPMIMSLGVGIALCVLARTVLAEHLTLVILLSTAAFLYFAVAACKLLKRARFRQMDAERDRLYAALTEVNGKKYQLSGSIERIQDQLNAQLRQINSQQL